MTEKTGEEVAEAVDGKRTIALDPLSAYLHRRIQAADADGLSMAAQLREQAALIADQQRLIDRLEAQLTDAAKGEMIPVAPKKAKEG